MHFLYLTVKATNEQQVCLSYAFNHSPWQSPIERQLPNLLDETLFSQQLDTIGNHLYTWLRNSDRFIASFLDRENHNLELGILAIHTEGKPAANFPWEALHDGNDFLANRQYPIVPIRWQGKQPLQRKDFQQNRPLKLLFMATAPTDSQPTLYFEAEEARLLEATKQHTLELTVEESGNLNELANLSAASTSENTDKPFDIFHLSGHATIKKGYPYFIVETEAGLSDYATAKDIVEALPSSLPHLTFLSGCSTGASSDWQSIPSMADALLQQGATAVLAWRDTVEDRDAIQAAATLYGQLAAGNPVIAALAATYRNLLSQNAPSWHLLQLYVGDTLPETLVTPIHTPGRETIRKQSSRERFFDADGQVKVVSREYFVGRRRELQQCLQALRSNETIGVLIYGMGGVGKSSLAARLCDRLLEFEPVVLVGTANESRLTPQLTPWLPSPNQSSMDDSFDQLAMSTMGMAGGGLTASQPQNQSLSLLQILMKIATNKQPLLLVFDDFESNLVASGNSYTLKPGTADLLRKLVTAIRESHLPHRILITSRCRFSFPESEAFLQLPLASMQGVEWQKKCQYLQYFYRNASIPQSIRDRALQLAGGNPRLLEGFYQILAEANPENLENVDPLLQKLEQTAAELRADSFVTELFSRQPVALQNMLKLASVYPLPVPKPIFAAICNDIEDFERHFQQAVALGLVETISQSLPSHPGKLPVTQNLYSVSSVLRWQWESQLEKQHYRRAAGFLYNYWWQLEPKSRLTYGKIHQLHRLSLAGECKEIAVKVTQKTAAAYNRSCCHHQAANICQQILSVFPDTRITLQLINAKRCLNQIDEAEKLSQQLIDACRANDNEFLAYILIEDSRIKFFRGDWETAVRNLQKALEIGDRDGNPIVQIRTRCMLSFSEPKQTHRDRSSDFIEEALDILNENKNSLPNWQEYANDVFIDLGWRQYKQGNNQEAYQNFSKVWSASRRNNQISWEAMSLLGMAMVELEYKRLDRSKNYCYEALERFERLNYKPQQAMVWHILTLIFMGYQDVEKATECSRRCLEICEKIDCPMIAVMNLSFMAWMESCRKNWQGVLYFYEKAVATCTSSQNSPEAEMVIGLKKRDCKGSSRK